MKHARAFLLLVFLTGAAALPAQEPTLLAPGKARRVVRPDDTQLHSLAVRQLNSDLVVRGRVVDEVVRLSDDRTTMWTDYTIEVLAVLKPARSGPAVGSRLVTAREGGNLIVDGKPVSVVNELFAPLPWVREHIFMLKKSPRGDAAYDFLDGPRSILRRDDAGKMRCQLPREEWDYFCTSYDGTDWQELLTELKAKD